MILTAMTLMSPSHLTILNPQFYMKANFYLCGSRREEIEHAHFIFTNFLTAKIPQPSVSSAFSSSN